MESGKTVIELEHAIGYSCQVPNSLFYHPNGKEFVQVGGGCVMICDLNDPHKQEFLRGHDDDITALTLSNKGTYMASGQIGKNADVCVWKYNNRKLLFRLSEHDYGVSFVQFTKDELLLLTIGDVRDNRIIVWDVSNGYVVVSTYIDKQMRRKYVDQTATRSNCIATWGGKTRDIKRRETDRYQFALVQDNRMFLFEVDPYNGKIERFNIDCKAHDRRYTCLQFNEMGNMIYAGTESGDVLIINVRNRQFLSKVRVCSLGVNVFSFYDNENGVIIGGGDGTITDFDRKSNSISYYQQKEEIIPMKKYELPHGVKSIAVSSSSSSSSSNFGLLVGTSGADIFSVRHSGKNELNKPMIYKENHFGKVLSVAFRGEESDCFSTCSSDGTVRFWNMNEYSVLSSSSFKGAHIPRDICFVRDIIFSCWDNGSLRSIDSMNGEALWERKEAHRSGIECLLSGRNSKYLISGGTEGAIKVWSVKGLNLISNLKDHRLGVTCFELFEDDLHFLSGSRDKSIYCWDLRKEKSVSTYFSKMSPVYDISLRKCSQHEFISIGGKVITCWDTRQPKYTHLLKFSMEEPQLKEGWSVDFTNGNGNYFATGGTDELVQLFDYRTKKMISKGAGHSNRINKVRFTPDDKQLVSVGDDGMIFIWNLFEF